MRQGMLPRPGQGVPCPDCGAFQLARSRTRGWFEALRKKWLEERLYRCAQCGWRGWLLPVDAPRPRPDADADDHGAFELPGVEPPAVDQRDVPLDRLDKRE